MNDAMNGGTKVFVIKDYDGRPIAVASTYDIAAQAIAVYVDGCVRCISEFTIEGFVLDAYPRSAR